MITLPALQKNFVNKFFVFAWEFCIEKWRGFLVKIFLVSVSHKRSTESPRKIRGKFGAKFGAKPGKKIPKIGKLSFCYFSDLIHEQLCPGTAPWIPFMSLSFLRLAKMHY